jgi:hypothetical protein
MSRPPSRAEPPGPTVAAAAALLRDQLSHTPPLPRPGERAQGIAALEAALGQRARRRYGGWIAAGLLATAAAAAVLFAWPPAGAPGAGTTSAMIAARPLTVASLQGPRATIVGPAGTRAAAAGTAVATGESVAQLPGGSFVATLASGARLELREGPLDVIESGARERLLLRAGAVRLSVPKLGPDRRLIVSTPDAEVEVHGTRFSVAMAEPDPLCGGGTRTRVVVEEGVVAVRHGGVEVRLTAGQRWPGCQPAPLPPVRAARPAHHQRGLAHVDEEVPAPAVVAPQPSTLAEENDLFAAAVSARRRGQDQEAARLLDELLRRFPSGPLAGHAHAERRTLESPPQRSP